MRIVHLLLASFIVSACATSATIVPTGSQPEKMYAPTLEESVEIYRTHGPYLHFNEMGMIVWRTTYLDLNGIYSQLRKDAAAKGAEAIIDLKIQGEQHEESNWVDECEPVTICDSLGNCYTQQQCHPQLVTKLVRTYTSQGTLIRSQK